MTVLSSLRALWCDLVGHSFTAGPWRRSPFTCATHYRDHVCQRCGATLSEAGYFDARNRDAWPGDAQCP